MIKLKPLNKEQREAALVVDTIVAEKQKHALRYGDFAILYRTNAPSPRGPSRKSDACSTSA